MVLFQNFLPRFRLQGRQTKNPFFVLLQNKIYGAIAKIANAVKQYYRVIRIQGTEGLIQKFV